MELGEFIKEYREKQKLSVRELGKLVDVSGPYISMIENNKINNVPSKELLERLVVALKLSDEEEEVLEKLRESCLKTKLNEKYIKMIKKNTDEIINIPVAEEEMKKENIVNRLKISRINKGQIVSEDDKYFIVMDRILHTFPGKKPIENVNKDYKVYDNFIKYYAHEKIESIICWFEGAGKEYGIILKAPYKIANIPPKKKGGYKYAESLKISIEYDEKLKIPYFLIGVPSGKRGITTLRIFLTIDAPFIFNVFRPFFIQKFSQVI